MTAPAPRLRIDIWLWRARFFKSRTLAAHAVAAGAVRLERAGAVRLVIKPSEEVGPGDSLLLAAPRGLLALRIQSLGARRGPPEEARALYAALDGADQPGHVLTPPNKEG